MSLGANDITQMLNDYIKSPEVQKQLKEEGVNLTGYTDEEMKLIAAELRDDIINAYFSLLRESRHFFDVGGVHIGNPSIQPDGKNQLIISFSGKSLFRQSLYSDYIGAFTGSGISDIFSLFSNGYQCKKTVYGLWMDSSASDAERGEFSYIKSRKSRSPNSFISDTINVFKNKYPTVGVKYPKEWGGMV